MPLMEILIGPIHSGKSTYCQDRAKTGAIIVNDDLVVKALHANDYLLYEEALKPLYKAVENQIIQMALALGRDVIVDRGTNMSARSRRRFIGLAAALDAPVLAVVFPNHGPKFHGQARATTDGRGWLPEHWVQCALRHQQEYVRPTLEEGFIEVIPVPARVQEVLMSKLGKV